MKLTITVENPDSTATFGEEAAQRAEEICRVLRGAVRIVEGVEILDVGFTATLRNSKGEEVGLIEVLP